MLTYKKTFRAIRLDIESKQSNKLQNQSSMNHQSSISLIDIIKSEFAHLTMDRFSYEVKPMHDKSSVTSSIVKDNNSSRVNDYELTCRLIEVNMPIVPPLKMKLTMQYPHEPPEVLSLSPTTLNMMPTKIENSG